MRADEGRWREISRDEDNTRSHRSCSIPGSVRAREEWVERIMCIEAAGAGEQRRTREENERLPKREVRVYVSGWFASRVEVAF